MDNLKKINSGAEEGKISEDVEIKQIDEREQYQKPARERLLAKTVKSEEKASALANQEAVSVSINSGKHGQHKLEKINSIIQDINVAVKTTEEITVLFEGISGILEQAAKTDSMERLKLLEIEARDLAREVEKIAEASPAIPTPGGAEETALVDIEKRLAVALDELKSPPTDKKLAPAEIVLDNPDARKATSRKLEETKVHLGSLTETIKETAVAIRKAIEIGQVAFENSEASTVLVRDVDAALELAQKASFSINSDPGKAISAIGESKLGTELLKS